MALHRLLPVSLVLGLAIYPGAPPEGCEDEPTPAPVLEDCSDESRTFFAWDLGVMPPATIELEATCRVVGPNAYLYVADDVWGTYVDDDVAQRFMETMEFSAGPGALDPNAGIIANNKEVFGEVPDSLDDDPRFYFLLMDMADFVSSDGDTFSFDGYFNSLDQLPDETVERITQGFYRSNEVEILYLNARIRPVDDPYTLAVAAHEMQHLIHYNYDTDESLWMGECLAEVAMLVNGYYTDEPWVESYARKPYTPLVTNGPSGSYGAFLLFGMYLYETLGADFMIPLESQQQDGILGLNRALIQGGFDTDFASLFSDWIVANDINDPSFMEGQFGYDFAGELPPMLRSGSLESEGDRVDVDLLSFGVSYVDVPASDAPRTLEIDADGPIECRFITKNSGIAIHVTDSLEPGVNSLAIELNAGQEGTLVLANMDESSVDTEVPVQVSIVL